MTDVGVRNGKKKADMTTLRICGIVSFAKTLLVQLVAIM